MLVVKINAIAIHPWGLSTKGTTQIGLIEPAGKQSKLLANKNYININLITDLKKIIYIYIYVYIYI